MIPAKNSYNTVIIYNNDNNNNNNNNIKIIIIIIIIFKPTAYIPHDKKTEKKTHTHTIIQSLTILTYVLYNMSQTFDFSINPFIAFTFTEREISFL